MSENEGSPRADPRSLLGEVEKRLQRELKNGPGRAPSAFEIVLANITTIHQMKRNRFTDAQIVKFLADIGITVTLGTFATYYSKALTQTGKAVPRKRGRPSLSYYEDRSGGVADPRPSEPTLMSHPPIINLTPRTAAQLLARPASPSSQTASIARTPNAPAAKPKGKLSLGFESKFDDE